MAKFAVERTYNVRYLQSILFNGGERRFGGWISTITTYDKTV